MERQRVSSHSNFTLEFDALNISHSVENKNIMTNETNDILKNVETTTTTTENNNLVDVAAEYRGHVRVADLTAVPPQAYYLGLDDCVYFDMIDINGEKVDPQVKFTKDLDEIDEKCFTLTEKGSKERVYTPT